MIKTTILITLAFTVTAVDADDAATRERLASAIPGIEADAVEESVIPGLYELTVGPHVFYLSADGRYLFRGEVVDLTVQDNLTETRRTRARAAWLDDIPESSMVIFEPEGVTRHTITVFTDIDCAYCRRLHDEIDELLASGVRVRYLLYPRSGPGTASATKSDAVWCSPDRQGALTRAKAGRRVTAKDCGETPVLAHLRLGRALNISGTPTILTAKGDIIRGYVPHAKLVTELERLDKVH